MSPLRDSSLARLQGVIRPIATLLLMLLAWEASVVIFNVPAYLLPRPSAVLVRTFESAPQLLAHAGPTLLEILLGFGLSIVVGVPLAVAVVSSRRLEQSLYPIIVLAQIVPKIAVAPLFVVWFGFGLEPKILIAFLIAFFPVVIDTAVGLRSIPQEMIDLARSMGAGATGLFVKIRFPHALPSFFGGLKVAITLAVIGAIVGEFVSSNRGLGYLLLTANGQLDTTLLFADIVVLSLIGILLFWAIDAVERLAIPWHVSHRQPPSERGTL